MPEVTSPTIADEKRNASTSAREFARFFLPLLRPYWKGLCLAGVAIVMGTAVKPSYPCRSRPPWTWYSPTVITAAYLCSPPTRPLPPTPPHPPFLPPPRHPSS